MSDPIALKTDMYLGGCDAETSVKFQSGAIILKLDLTTSRFRKIWR